MKNSEGASSSAPVRGLHPVHGERERIERVSAHFTRWIGPPVQVFHETVSELVHVDVHVLPPRPQHPFITLFTSGMSERPMPGACTCGCCPTRMELMMTLPADWSLPPPNCGCGRHPPAPRRKRARPHRTWPVTELRHLARYPHASGTWLGWGHTFASDHPPRPLAEGTRFCAMMLLPSVLAPVPVAGMEGPDGEPVQILAVYPLYAEELALKLAKGSEALVERFERWGVTELVDVRRVNVATGR